MLTKIIPGEATKRVAARAAAAAHPLPDLGFGKPTGEFGAARRGAVGTVAPAESGLGGAVA